VEDERLRAEILALLERHPGNVAAVARELNRPRSSVQRLMARLGIDRGA
jgi:DNA-binding IclR family transcriptional regulator